MKRKLTMRSTLVIFLSVTSMLLAQFNFTAKVQPYGLYRLSDQSEISLPFRLAELTVDYSRGNWDLKTNTALEYRWSNGEYDIDFREYYAVYYPSFGEIKVGKQIFAWGAADGNNPTDNLNPYDYYYLFEMGSDRKIGLLSLAADLYFDNWNLEVVLLPQHAATRMPYGEEDFPLFDMEEPSSDLINEVEGFVERGIRGEIQLANSDISVSFFDGYDRSLNLLGVTWGFPGLPPILTYGYRRTQVLGADWVTFWGAVTLRAEGALFKTENQDKSSAMPLEAKATYAQYVVQVEIDVPSDIKINGQLLGNRVIDIEGKTMDFSTFSPVPLTKDNFIPGLGTPFAMFAEKGLFIGVNDQLLDDRLELELSVFKDLEEKGIMIGANVSYSFNEHIAFDTRITKFIGEEGNLENPFTRLEDFSHFMVGLTVRF